MNDLWKNRTSFNDKAISIMKETEFSKDMIELALDDAEMSRLCSLKKTGRTYESRGEFRSESGRTPSVTGAQGPLIMALKVGSSKSPLGVED